MSSPKLLEPVFQGEEIAITSWDTMSQGSGDEKGGDFLFKEANIKSVSTSESGDGMEQLSDASTR